MIKKIIILITFCFSLSSFAGFYESEYFEPVALGGAFAVGGYLSGGDNAALLGAGGFFLGYVLGTTLNDYQRNKIDERLKNEVTLYRNQIQEKESDIAQRIKNGENIHFSIKADYYEAGKELPGGLIISPGTKTKLMMP